MKLPSGHGVVAACAVLAFAACGGGGGSKASPSTSSSSAGKTSATRAFIDLQTCDNAGGTGTATGTIENQGTKAVAYTITVGFFTAGGNKKLGAGTDTTSTVSPGASADWAVTASGLGRADPDCHTLGITTGGAVSGGTTTTTGTAAEEFPCDLVAQNDVSRIVGNPVDPGDAVTTHVTEGQVGYTARQCIWGAPIATDGTDARLQVSRAEDNDGADPGCPPIPGSSVPVVGLGTSATWSWVDPGTSTTVGTLRVCSAPALIEVTITGSTSGDAHLAAARAVAEQALSAL